MINQSLRKKLFGKSSKFPLLLSLPIASASALFVLFFAGTFLYDFFIYDLDLLGNRQPHLELVVARYSQQETLEAVSVMQTLKIDGQLGQSDWLEVVDDSFVVAGLFIPEGIFASSNGGLRSLTPISFNSLIVPEALEEVTVFHLLPIVVDENTIEDDSGGIPSLRNAGGMDAFDGFVAAADAPTNQPPYGPITFEVARVRIAIHEGWLHAEEIAFIGTVAYTGDARGLLSGTLYDLDQFESDIAEHIDDSVHWLKVESGQTATMKGYEIFYRADKFNPASPDCFPEVSQLAVPGRLGIVPIYHIVHVHGRSSELAPRGSRTNWSEEMIEVDITLDSGRLVYVR